MRGVKLPRAVASDDGKPRDPRSRRLAMVVAIFAAMCVIGAYLIKPVPGTALTMFGGAGGGLARWGGLRLVWQPPPSVDLAALEARFARRAVRAELRVDNGVVTVEVPG